MTKRSRKREYISISGLALAYIGLADLNEALTQLELVNESHEIWTLGLIYWQHLDLLRERSKIHGSFKKNKFGMN